MNQEQYLKNLEVPTGCVDAVLDTDTYNEIDDQFAVCYQLLHAERIRTVGICAAPFLNELSTSPADGMEKSYAELERLLELLGRPGDRTLLHRGSTSYLPDEKTPVISDAARFLADKAREYSPEHPLYVVAIGAITNVASAILLDPEAMRENTVIVWLGGNALHWEKNNEFNLRQDRAAARVIFGCGAPLVMLPCAGVVDKFRTTEGELRAHLSQMSRLCDYLVDATVRAAERYAKGTAWSRVIWDVTAVAWLLNDENRFLRSRLIPSPIPNDDGTWSTPADRHLIRYVYDVRRDALFTDLFSTLKETKN